MRVRILIGIVLAVVLTLGVTTWARQRGTPDRVVEPPMRVNDFVPAGDAHIFRRTRIEHVRSIDGDGAEVFLIGREQPIRLTPEEAKALRRAIAHPALIAEPDLDLEPLPDDGRPDFGAPPPRRDSPFHLLPPGDE